MLDCLFIGSTTKDTLLLVDAPPASDQRIAASAVVHTCGGVASVAASAFQKLGGSAGLITAVGDPSDVTDFIAKNIMARNLPYASLLRVPGTNSPFSAIQVESNGKRCITHFGGCIRQLTLDMLDKQALADTNMIHLGGLEEFFCAELATYCKEHTDALISVDGGNLSREATDRMLPYVDVISPYRNRWDAHRRTPAAIMQRRAYASVVLPWATKALSPMRTIRSIMRLPRRYLFWTLPGPGTISTVPFCTA